MTESPKAAARHPGRPLLFLGVFLAFAGVVVFFVLTFAFKVLVAPWYAPVLGTLGVALIFLSLSRSRTVWRWTAAVFFTLFVGFQWWGVFGLRTPAYTGPVKDGTPFPAFATTLADGSSFTQADLQGDKRTIMVFFRGHW